MLANAALDRLADRAHVLLITGRSYGLTRESAGEEGGERGPHPRA